MRLTISPERSEIYPDSSGASCSSELLTDDCPPSFLTTIFSPTFTTAMNIYTAEQIREWDQYTILNEPIRSIDLMERAAACCVEWIRRNHLNHHPFIIFCGKGNNGGDGLAIARILIHLGCQVQIYIMEEGKTGTPDFQENLHRLHPLTHQIHYIQSLDFFPVLSEDAIIIDALFGTGLNRPLSGLFALLTDYINRNSKTIISVDMPSGLMADKTVKGETFIHATYTLCFQRMKRCMLMAENASALGEVHVLSIGLHPGFETNHESPYQLLSDLTITSLLKVRNRFAHKGNYGHALLIGGSEGKMGAVLLAVSAMLRSGVGLATAYVPGCGKKILPVSSPEAMTEFDSNEQLISQLPKNPEKYSAIGIGPGLGTDPATAIVVEKIINESEAPLIIDADALNILSKNKKLLSELPKGSILTPHPKEWERLCGTSANDFERHRLVVEKAGEWNCVIILKGHHTLVAGPDGKSRYNTTGNPGMAKGGSGDVLTGLLTGLIASGYSAHDASLIGVYLHGLAGDRAASKLSEEAMIAGDLIDFLPSAWQKLKSTSS